MRSQWGLLRTDFVADYYVSTTGSDSNPGTFSSPFLTIAKARDTATAGKKIRVLPGTYTDASLTKDGIIYWLDDGAIVDSTGTIWHSPASAATLIVRGYGDFRVSATGANVVLCQSYAHLFDIEYKSMLSSSLAASVINKGASSSVLRLRARPDATGDMTLTAATASAGCIVFQNATGSVDGFSIDCPRATILKDTTGATTGALFQFAGTGTCGTFRVKQYRNAVSGAGSGSGLVSVTNATGVTATIESEFGCMCNGGTQSIYAVAGNITFKALTPGRKHVIGNRATQASRYVIQTATGSPTITLEDCLTFVGGTTSNSNGNSIQAAGTSPVINVTDSVLTARHNTTNTALWPMVSSVAGSVFNLTGSSFHQVGGTSTTTYLNATASGATLNFSGTNTKSNSGGYAANFTTVTGTPATTDANSVQRTWTFSGSTVTCTGHGLSTGDKIYVWDSETFGLPSPLDYGVPYYVRNTGTNTLTFHPTSTDATNDTNAITLSGGSGTWYLVETSVSV